MRIYLRFFSGRNIRTNQSWWMMELIIRCFICEKEFEIFIWIPEGFMVSIIKIYSIRHSGKDFITKVKRQKKLFLTFFCWCSDVAVLQDSTCVADLPKNTNWSHKLVFYLYQTVTDYIIIEILRPTIGCCTFSVLQTLRGRKLSAAAMNFSVTCLHPRLTGQQGRGGWDRMCTRYEQEVCVCWNKGQDIQTGNGKPLRKQRLLTSDISAESKPNLLFFPLCLLKKIHFSPLIKLESD